MVMGIPVLAFLAFIIQPVIIILAILYAVFYEKLIQKPPFDFFSRLEDECGEKK